MEAKLSEEFVEVTITKGIHKFTEYHATVIKNKEENFKRHTRENLNIAMIMLESQSHSNVQRYLQKTYSWLKNDPNTHIFKGHTKVGDATTPALLAMLANMEESNAPEARKGFNGAETVNRFPFVFNELKNAGYVTVYGEDDPHLGAFQLRLLGFRDQPTNKYLRTFWNKAYHTFNRHHTRCVHQFSFAYLKKFFTAYSKEKSSYFSTIVQLDTMQCIQYLSQTRTRTMFISSCKIKVF